MTPPHPDEHPINRHVRDHLDREAAKVDARAMLARVKAARPVPTTPRPWRRWVAGVAAGLTVAAGVALVFVLGGGPEPQPVSAAALVREAQEAHATPADRCYEVTAELDPGPLSRLQLPPVRTSRLWTRGDQFWIAGHGPTGNPYAWGQGKDGRVWVALGRKRGLLYDPSESGEPITRYVELMSLRAVSTLGELLEQYDLFRRDTGQPGEPVRIEATFRPTPRNPNPRFRGVELELDRDTKVIRKAVLRRQVNGEAVGTLTFTLVEAATQLDDQYELRGHLDPDAVTLDGRGPLPGMGPPPRPPGLGTPPTRRFGPPPWPDPRARFRDEFLKRMQEKTK